MINPVVEPSGSATEEDWEGRLSIPDVRVAALDRFGVRHAMTASGFPARVIQHETDHLDGVLFLDRMSSFESLTFLSEYARYWAQEKEPA